MGSLRSKAFTRLCRALRNVVLPLPGIVVFGDDFGVFDFIIELFDFHFVVGLFGARRVVFRVFGKVAVRTRFRDARNDFLALGALQVFEQLHRFVVPFLRHLKFFSHVLFTSGIFLLIFKSFLLKVF